MDSSAPPQPPHPSSATANPIVAVGRKVKSVLSSQQRPSIRILRGSPSSEKPLPPPPSRGKATGANSHPELPQHSTAHADSSHPSSHNTFADRFYSARSHAEAGFRSLFSGENHSINEKSQERDRYDEYDSDTVDLMDVVDPEVATLSTLTNVQNSLFVPSLGKILNRRPAFRISEQAEEARTIDKVKATLKRLANVTEGDEKEGDPKLEEQQATSPLKRIGTAGTTFDDAKYAILPDGEGLTGWTQAEKDELDDLVRHMLHSRRARSKRAMKGFWQYVRRPLGLFITVYATLITLFGAAWVLFLIGWISVGSKKSYVINIVDNVLVALFAIIGDGLAPFRAVDTYHMIYIAKYHRKTWKRREKLGLPELADHNDLPEQRKYEVEPKQVDIESLIARRMPRGIARRVAPRIPKRLAHRMVTRSKVDHPTYEYTVLSDEEQAKLEFHERKFSKSHTFYKPHETETHFAFPLKLLVAIVLLLDLHSCLQITLGACTWGINYKKRPFALTTVVLCCSITCNILGGVLISIGDKRTRKKDVIERMMRQELTSEAIEELETRRLKEAEERGEVDPAVRKRLEDERDNAENEEIKKSWKVVPSLPKTLLGKGVDHRQPSLPQQARRSSSNVDSEGSGSTTPKNSKSKSGPALPPVQENPVPSLPKPVVTKGPEPPREATGRKIMRFIRRADLDRS